MRSRPSGQAGFTLLELLVALVVLGFVISGLAGGTQLALASMRTQTRFVQRHQDLQPVDQLLRRLVAGMVLPGDARLAGLAGKGQNLICITKLPDSDGSLIRVDASLAVDAEHRLVLQWLPHLHARSVAPAPEPATEILLAQVRRVEFSYLSPAGDGWLSSWNRADLPALIRVRLVFSLGDPRQWPPIIAATRQQSRPSEGLSG